MKKNLIVLYMRDEKERGGGGNEEMEGAIEREGNELEEGRGLQK